MSACLPVRLSVGSVKESGYGKPEQVEMRNSPTALEEHRASGGGRNTTVTCQSGRLQVIRHQQRPAVQTRGKVTNTAKNTTRLARGDSPALLRGASSPFQQVQSQNHPGSNGGVLPRHILTKRRHDSCCASDALRRTRAFWEFCELAKVFFFFLGVFSAKTKYTAPQRTQ